MNYTTTTNGAKQYKTSNDECVDLFSKIGSMRHWDRRDILEYFEKAFEHNPELATRITYWARAARAGSGERKTFYTILDENHLKHYSNQLEWRTEHQIVLIHNMKLAMRKVKKGKYNQKRSQEIADVIQKYVDIEKQHREDLKSLKIELRELTR